MIFITSNLFHYLPFILTGVCVLSLLALIGTLVVMLIIRKKKSKMPTQVPMAETEAKMPPMELSMGAAQTIGARENQQDSYTTCMEDKTALAVVADGMGGLQNGAEISGIVSYVCNECYSRLVGAPRPEFELMNMVRSANEQACDYIDKINGEKSGSTLVAVYVVAGNLYFTSVGDSRIYLMRNKSLVQLNREHIYAYELDSKVMNGEMVAEKALNNRERKALTSYMGMGNLKYVDRNLEPIILQRNDVILLSSDGVFNTLSDEEMISILDSAATSEEAAQSIIDAVNARMKPRQDNATAVVMFYQRG